MNIQYSNVRIDFRKLLVVIVLITGILFQLRPGISYSNSKYISLEEDTTDYYKLFVDKELHTLDLQIDTLQLTARGYNESKKTLEQLQIQVKKTRNAFKRIEGIANYCFPEHIKAYINGPPLDHVDPLPIGKGQENKTYYMGSVENYKYSAPLDMLEAGHYSGANDDTVIPPVGLQKIDELVFSDEAEQEKSQIVSLADNLKKYYEVLKEALLYRKLYHDFEIMESSRVQLVKILSMGITGFDTPGSLNGLQEASSSLHGIEDILKPIIQRSTANKQKEVNELFVSTQNYLSKHNNFVKFDRLTFIKLYLNPLYKSLLNIQKELNIPSSASKYNKTPSWNAYSDNFFGNDFLNPYYYSLLKEKNDSPELKELGKKLFFDKQLSSNNTISCASCHKPELGYTDGEKTSTSALAGVRVSRNSPTLINAVFSDRYFYDLRAYDLEDQAGHVIENHLEFNSNFEDIVKKLNKDEAYKKAFLSIFGTKEINRYQFSSALASFVISLRSFNSPFDKYMRGETNRIDNGVKRGFNLFMGKANCATCHYAPAFSGLIPPLYKENESEVLGVLQSPGLSIVDTDPGRIKNGIYNDQQRIYNRSFKTTTVRNTALTAPYFHNGAYNTLEEVIDFYNKGGAAGIGLSNEVPNQTLSAEPLKLTKSEIRDLKAFIISLNDIPNL